VVSALRARSLVDVLFTNLMAFFTYHRLVTRPMVRAIMDAAQAFIEEKLAILSPKLPWWRPRSWGPSNGASFRGCARRAL
jgi:hypothetical protein